ncbi:MAG: hypothetical protein CBD95_005230 [Flavobacteriales bacterium TMED235]|nr:MAG: hypothetical protein CBD95_005230 [Flavobacteriales bacterium TMED235]
MSIIKIKLTQMILVGLLFSMILGALSYVVRNSISSNETNYEKQIVIVDVNYKNKLNNYLNKLNEIGYLNRDLVFSKEFFKSLKYIKIRYQRDKKLSAGCYNLNMNLTDNSIFLETYTYPIKNKKLMDECLNNLFSLSFDRLKEKLDIYNYREVSLINFELDGESTDDKNESIENQEAIQKKQDPNKIDEISNQICSDLDEIIEGFNITAEDKIKLNNDTENIGKSFLSVFNLHQGLIAAQTLDQICQNLEENKKIFEDTKKKDFVFHLNALKDLIDETEFTEIFKVEIINSVIDNPTNQYLSTKNIVLTFSIFGFIFGVLLVYNFGSSKNKNE